MACKVTRPLRMSLNLGIEGDSLWVDILTEFGGRGARHVASRVLALIALPGARSTLQWRLSRTDPCSS